MLLSRRRCCQDRAVWWFCEFLGQETRGDLQDHFNPGDGVPASRTSPPCDCSIQLVAAIKPTHTFIFAWLNVDCFLLVLIPYFLIPDKTETKARDLVYCKEDEIFLGSFNKGNCFHAAPCFHGDIRSMWQHQWVPWETGPGCQSNTFVCA